MFNTLNTQLRLRNRTRWEAMDAGILLWEKNLPAFIRGAVLPLFCAGIALRFLPAPWHYASYLILWYLKPLYDRMLLHILSQRFFNPGFSSPWKKPWKSLFSSLPGDLLWRRFSINRAVHMPLRLLEGLKGRQYWARIRALERNGPTGAGPLCLLSLTLEWALLSGEISFIFMMLQLLRPDLLPFIQEYILNLEKLVFIFFIFNLAFIESLYVCMGFGLYINCRVDTEGWDLQLLFRQFTERRKKTAGPAQRIGKGTLLCVLLLIGTQHEAHADNGTAEHDFPYTVLEEVLSAREFGGTEEVWRVRFKQTAGELKTPEFSSLFNLSGLNRFSAYALRTALLVLGLLLLGAAGLYWYGKHSPAFKKTGKLRTSAETDETEPDPEQLLEKAVLLYNRDEYREAWALCFRTALLLYRRLKDLHVPDWASEQECLALIQKNEADPEGNFKKLVQARIQSAYEGQAPDHERFDQSLYWCRSLLTAVETQGAGTDA